MEEHRELAERMARAFRELGAFVVQKGLDNPSHVLRLVRELELGPLINVATLPGGIYVLTLNTRPCNVECRLKECAGLENAREKARCIEDCMTKCRAKLVERVAGVLAEYAGRGRTG